MIEVIALGGRTSFCEFPLWVSRRHQRAARRCSKRSLNRTLDRTAPMSLKCQKPTFGEAGLPSKLHRTAEPNPTRLPQETPPENRLERCSAAYNASPFQPLWSTQTFGFTADALRHC
jgi:hypothetical protein